MSARVLNEPVFQRAGAGCLMLQRDMRAVDTERSWAVPTGFVTDGASIPPLCWPLVGHPYSPSSLRAAILHDYLCRSRDPMGSVAVHRVFYDVLRADGVAWLRAQAMWLAVRVFGPRWAASV